MAWHFFAKAWAGISEKSLFCRGSRSGRRLSSGILPVEMMAPVNEGSVALQINCAAKTKPRAVSPCVESALVFAVPHF
jgi:hypothetical protein